MARATFRSSATSRSIPHGEYVDVGHRVAVGVDPEEQPILIRDDRHPDSVVAGDRDEWPDHLERRPEGAKSSLRAGDVRDRHVEQPLGEQRLGEHVMQDGRREAGEAEQRLGADRQRGVLDRRRPLADLLVARDSVRLGYRQVDEQRADVVSQRVAVLVLAAHVHRDHRTQTLFRDLLAASLEDVAQPRRHSREDDVVDGPAERVLDRANVVEIDDHRPHRPARADRLVQARVGRSPYFVAQQQLCEPGRAAREFARVTGGVQCRVGAVHDQVGCQPPQHVLLRLRCGGLGREGLTYALEQQVGRVDRADAVDEAVMGLRRQRPAPFGQPVEHHDFPQRHAALEPQRVVLARPGQQRVEAARRRKRRSAHVPRHVEVLVVDPTLPAEAAGRRRGEALAIARQCIEALIEIRANLLDARCLAACSRPEDEQAADVHVCGAVGVLEFEERPVNRCQVVGQGGHRGSPFASGRRQPRIEWRAKHPCGLRDRLRESADVAWSMHGDR